MSNIISPCVSALDYIHPALKVASPNMAPTTVYQDFRVNSMASVIKQSSSSKPQGFRTSYFSSSPTSHHCLISRSLFPSSRHSRIYFTSHRPFGDEVLCREIMRTTYSDFKIRSMKDDSGKNVSTETTEDKNRKNSNLQEEDEEEEVDYGEVELNDINIDELTVFLTMLEKSDDILSDYNNLTIPLTLKNAVLAMNVVCAKNEWIQFYEVDGKVVKKWTQKKFLTFIKSYLSGATFAGSNKYDVRKVDWFLEKRLKEEIFTNSAFNVLHSEEAIDVPNARLFAGEVKGPIDVVYTNLRKKLLQQYPELEILSLGDVDEYNNWFFVSYRDSLIRLVPRTTSWGILSTISIIFFLNHLTYTDPTLVSGVASALISLLLPLSFMAIILSAILGESLGAILYGMSPPSHIIPFPSPYFGAIGTCIRHCGYMPSRTSKVDIALCNTIFSTVASVALILAPPIYFSDNILSLSAFGFNEHVGLLPGVVLIPFDLFRHSAILSELSFNISTVTFSASGDEVLAIRPLALGGLLGLNFTAMNLLPIMTLNGGRILDGILREKFIIYILGCFIPILMYFVTFNPIWAFFFLNCLISLAFLENEPPLEGHKSPDLFRSCIGLFFVVAGFCTLLPPNIFGGVSSQIFSEITNLL